MPETPTPETPESSSNDTPTPASPPSEPSSNRTIMFILSYLWLLALVPLLAETGDSEVQWHAKHGIVLMVGEIVLWIALTILSQIPGIGIIFGCGAGAPDLAAHPGDSHHRHCQSGQRRAAHDSGHHRVRKPVARRLETGPAVVGFLLLFAVLVSWTRAPLYLEIQAVRSYRTVVSPWMGYVLTCRFQPTCSEYALQVLQEKGFWAGNLKIGQRLLQCSPVGRALFGSPCFRRQSWGRRSQVAPASCQRSNCSRGPRVSGGRPARHSRLPKEPLRASTGPFGELHHAEAQCRFSLVAIRTYWLQWTMGGDGGTFWAGAGRLRPQVDVCAAGSVRRSHRLLALLRAGSTGSGSAPLVAGPVCSCPSAAAFPADSLLSPTGLLLRSGAGQPGLPIRVNRTGQPIDPRILLLLFPGFSGGRREPAPPNGDAECRGYRRQLRRGSLMQPARRPLSVPLRGKS